VTLSEILIPELRIEAATTRTTLERVPSSSLAWKPHPRSRSLGELAAHVANIPGIFIAPLLEDLYDHDSYTAKTDTVPAILATFDRNVAKAHEALVALPDERFLATWTYRYGARVVFELPRLVVVRTAGLNHLVHHRGQLSLYLRMLDVPVPAIYGPSADES
jgi:uncharacterized damage-inducible protein DinB